MTNGRKVFTPEERAKHEAAVARFHWAIWLNGYGAAKFYDAFVQSAQDAQGTCIRCGDPIFLDIIEGGGVPDWRTADGDYGCRAMAEPDGGSHVPLRLDRS